MKYKIQKLHSKLIVLTFLLFFFIEPVLNAAGKVCKFCGMENCTMGCKGSEIDKLGAKLMLMPGMPSKLFYAGITLVLLLSFILSEVLDLGTKKKEYFKWNILKFPFIYSFIRKPYFQFIFQFPMFLAFIFLIYAGLFGHAVINIMPVMTWTIWWAGLIFIILFLGKTWCLVCPWDFIATLAQRLKPFGVSKKPMTLGLKWPKILRNIYPAIIAFIVLTWFELGFKITVSPRDTAILACLMIFIAVISALIFEKKSFCRYACFVGRISGLYAMFSPVELRRKSSDVCSNCKTKDCFKGNDKGTACPTSLLVPKIDANTYCILCTECIKSCPHENIAINVRPFGTDLIHFKKVSTDEAILALVLLTLTSFHGLTMTPLWDSNTAASVVGSIKDFFSISTLPAFTIGMTVCLLLPIFIYYLFCILTHYISSDKSVTVWDIFKSYSYSMLPIALFYHLAHNGMHLFMEGQYVIPLLSDPLGNGSNYFSTATMNFPPLLSANTIWIMQVIFVLIGHIYGILIAKNISRRLYKDKKAALKSLIPMLVGMIFFSFISLWLMHLDMNMRGSRM